MIEHYKAVFLPLDNRILSLYKGYILNDTMQPQLRKEDVVKETEYCEIDNNKSKLEQIFRVITIIPLVPLLFLAAVIATFFKKLDHFAKKSSKVIDDFFALFFKKRKIKKVRTEKIKEYEDIVVEDVLDFLTHCQKHFSKVFIYSYESFSEDDLQKLSQLMEKGLINSFKVITKLSDLHSLVLSESVSLHNSFFIIKDSLEAAEVLKFGIPTDYGINKHIELWKKRKSKGDGGKTELEWNSVETLFQMKRNITYYLQSKDRLFFTPTIIIFIEDEEDILLNSYVSKNLSAINKRLNEKKFELIYFPSLKNTSPISIPGIFDFLRYRNPILYSLSDSEIQSSFLLLIKYLTPKQFYRLLLDELELPYFAKPALLRNIAGGMPETENRFTYRTIEYSSVSDLDSFFDWYIDQIKIPNDYEHIYFSRALDPVEYNADWCFGKESKADTDELRLKIDSIKAEGKFGVLAEALMYMLEAIKDEQPDLISKVRPLIEKRRLLESKVVLSSIYIDKQKRIFLPEFGNTEVKMHALPKTVYLFFLQHPEGIRIKELYQYKKQLLVIYNTLTNKDENEEIQRAINDLVDMKKPNINMQCSRIRAAFRGIMDEHIAKYYYIDGQNGEPKKISLPQNLIDIRY